MDRLVALIRLGSIGGSVIGAVRKQIREKSLEELRRSAADVVGPYGEVLRPGFNHVETRSFLKNC